MKTRVIAYGLLTLILLATLTDAPNHWHALPDDVAANGRWERTADFLGVRLRMATPCDEWWSVDERAWHWEAALQPRFRPDGRDICYDYREPWFK